MRKTWGSIALAIGLLVEPTMSSAEYPYMGVGATTCGTLANAYRQNPSFVESTMMTWAQGFMSGMNVEMGLINRQYRDMEAISLDAQKQSLVAYCDEHPMADFIKAAVDLYKKLPFKKYPAPASH